MIEIARFPYYRTALEALRLLEAREPTGRRFGPDADVLWKTYATRDMSEVDRLDLLIRDADRQWRGAFGPRLVFDLSVPHDDEAFGPSWERVSPVKVRDIWLDTFRDEAPADAATVVDAWSQAWDRPLTEIPLDLGPNDRAVLVGASAIASAIAHFASHPELAWHRQVEVIATEPAERQLAVLAAPLLAAEGATVLVSTPSQDTRIIVSEDARPGDRAICESAAVET